MGRDQPSRLPRRFGARAEHDREPLGCRACKPLNLPLAIARIPGKDGVLPRKIPGFPAMKARIFKKLLVLSLVFAAGLLASCSRPFVLEAEVDAGEGVRRGSPVMLDQKGVGHVVEVGEADGRMIAEFEITDREARERLRQGLVRVKTGDAGRIDLRTSVIRDGAEPLRSGDHVPTVPVAVERTHFYTKAVNWALVGTILVGVGFFLSRMGNFMRVVMQFFCFLTALVLSYFAVPYITPYTAKWLDRIDPGAGAVEQQIEDQLARLALAGTNEVLQSVDKVVPDTSTGVEQRAVFRPSAQVAAWAICFPLLFLMLNLFLRLGFPSKRRT